MNVFKLRQGEHDCQKLTTTGFHFATGKRSPWYQSRAGKTMHYAVCPECDNPVHIVNLDVDHKVDGEGKCLPLYAKHAGGNVEGIGNFDEDAYDECSLANPKSFNGLNKTRRPGPTTAGIIDILVNHADAVQYTVDKFLGLSVSDRLFASMLEQFHKQEGYLYREVTTSNLPYALLYMAGNQDVTGCWVKDDSAFGRAVKKSQHFELSRQRIWRKANSSAQIHFFVTNHVIRAAESAKEQTMTLVIEEEISGQRHPLLREVKRLEVDQFCNMIAKRNRLREIAHKEFNGLIGAA
ncbi:HNH endonuclease [Burkholderia pseudomallei]|uniref:hypothetical protein n=1 Tax=Burkholderia pseudomallei TaxID=28450 RepID=UPI0005CA964A|nr:hypothetical protein [Burkholderia pseudomallei]KIX36898.1 hypothetical protein SZ28_20035 [Burkholderia pseudomallei]